MRLFSFILDKKHNRNLHESEKITTFALAYEK